MLNGINILILLVLVIGIIFLQIFLSKRSNKWFGFILPAISFIISLLLVVSIIAYTNVGIVSRSSSSEDGTIVSQEVEDLRPQFSAVVGQVCITFLLSNIPTVVLMSIYAACREKRKRQTEIDKMQIQDLE